MRTVALTSLCALSVGALVLTTNRPLQAGGTGYRFHLKSAPTLCMDGRGDTTKAGTEVWLTKCNDTDAQRWTITTDSDGLSLVVGPGGNCLDVTAGSTKTYTPMVLVPCNFGKNQFFKFAGDLLVQESTGKCIGVAKAEDKQPLRLEPCKGVFERQWLFEFNRK